MSDHPAGFLAPFPEVLAAIGGRARELRLLRNLTQVELAERSAVGVATVARFEKTGQVSIENALRMAVALSAEEGFERLFALPRYTSIDEALARPRSAASGRRRARKR